MMWKCDWEIKKKNVKTVKFLKNCEYFDFKNSKFVKCFFQFCMFFTCVFQYKYQINLDGTVAAYRFPYLMGGNSVVLKQDSPYYEHFYKSLEPNKHYIPFKRDLSNLREKILWAKSHDEEVKSFYFCHPHCHFHSELQVHLC